MVWNETGHYGGGATTGLYGVKWNWTPWGRGYNWSIWCEVKLDTMGEGLNWSRQCEVKLDTGGGATTGLYGVKWNWTLWGRGYNWSIWCEMKLDTMGEGLQLVYMAWSETGHYGGGAKTGLYGVKWYWTPWGRGYNWSILCEMKLDTMGEGLQLVYNVDQLINCQTVSLFSGEFRVRWGGNAMTYFLEYLVLRYWQEMFNRFCKILC